MADEGRSCALQPWEARTKDGTSSTTPGASMPVVADESGLSEKIEGKTKSLQPQVADESGSLSYRGADESGRHRL